MQVKNWPFWALETPDRLLPGSFLDKEDEIRRKYGCQVKVSAIATNSRGNLEDDDGIDLREALFGH